MNRAQLVCGFITIKAVLLCQVVFFVVFVAISAAKIDTKIVSVNCIRIFGLLLMTSRKKNNQTTLMCTTQKWQSSQLLISVVLSIKTMPFQ